MRSSASAGIGVATLSAALLLMAGCTRVPDPQSEVDTLARRLLPADALPGRHFVRQTVTIRWRDGHRSFDAVLQKSDDTLLLLGLGPLQRVGFAFSLSGGRVHVENRSGIELPFGAEYVLADVQRIFYPWLDADPAKRVCADGERSGQRLGLTVVERCERGRLVERRFRSPGHPQLGEIRVRFPLAETAASEAAAAAAGAQSPASATAPALPPHALLHNAWLGYELEVRESVTPAADAGPAIRPSRR